MYTRQQYLNKECTHRQYYAQFVDDRVKSRIFSAFTIEQLVYSFDQDENFNTSITPLGISYAMPSRFRSWSGIGYEPFPVAINPKELGDWLTPAGITCILKEAAEQIVEAYLLVP